MIQALFDERSKPSVVGQHSNIAVQWTWLLFRVNTRLKLNSRNLNAIRDRGGSLPWAEESRFSVISSIAVFVGTTNQTHRRRPMSPREVRHPSDFQSRCPDRTDSFSTTRNPNPRRRFAETMTGAMREHYRQTFRTIAVQSVTASHGSGW
jgi:hypothetical protein